MADNGIVACCSLVRDIGAPSRGRLRCTVQRQPNVIGWETDYCVTRALGKVYQLDRHNEEKVSSKHCSLMYLEQWKDIH